jgi:uncharacterized protein (TIGR02186 family)
VRRGPLTFLAAAMLMAGVTGEATAERLITSLSQHRFGVTSSFNGSEVVLFGGIERESGLLPLRGNYDIAVTVIGPRQDIVVFRKERVLGIWVNYDSRIFANAPSFFSVLTNRKLEGIANVETLRRLQLGLDNLALPQRLDHDVRETRGNDQFRDAFLKLKEDHKLYSEEPSGVTFLAPALFRASIELPAEVPIGTYEVDASLFADGVAIDRAPSALEIYKAGFEQVVTTTAQNHGLLYGIVTAMMAILTGWFASVVFRRD